MPEEDRVERFSIHFSAADLDDLHHRLSRTRYAAATLTPPQPAGLAGDDLRSIVDSWLETDWRSVETQLNRYDHLRVALPGVKLHAALRSPARQDAQTVLLLHGWPYSFAEMLPLADQLDDVNVVIPSLPGFVFSTIDDDYSATPDHIAETMAQLMETLGIDRYIVYGEDIGAPVADHLAAKYPQVVGIHATHPAFPASSPGSSSSTDEELQFEDWLAVEWDGARAYADIQQTRPDTLAAGLIDSPAGLAAWIVEKLLAWSDDRPEHPRGFTMSDVLTTVMLYWATESVGTSFRTYHDSSRTAALTEPVRIPATVSVHHGERRYPEAMARRTYLDLRHFGAMNAGGHFTALEAPIAVANDLRRLIDLVAAESN